MSASVGGGWLCLSAGAVTVTGRSAVIVAWVETLDFARKGKKK